MPAWIDSIIDNSHGWIPFVVALTIALFLALILKKLIFQAAARVAARTAIKWDDVLIDRAQAPATALLLTLAMLFCFQFAPLPAVVKTEVLRILRAAGIFSTAWLFDRSIVALTSTLVMQRLGAGGKAFLKNFLRILIFVLAFMGMLDNFGISITPLIASLGIGSLAVALALQDTLGNFFSGIYILADQPVRVGDTIRLEDGTEGIVVKIGWRSSHILMGSNNYAVIPNSKLSTSKIINFDLGSSETSLNIEIGIAYEADLQKVERVTYEVGKAILATVEGAVSGFEPVLRYGQFGDSAIKLTVVLRAQRISAEGLIRHEFIKALHARYKQEKIDIPYPQTVVHLSREGVKA